MLAAVGSVAAVWTLWQRLGLDGWFANLGAERGAEVLEHAVFAMVANRLLAPRSKRALRRVDGADVVMPDGLAGAVIGSVLPGPRRGGRRQGNHREPSCTRG